MTSQSASILSLNLSYTDAFAAVQATLSQLNSNIKKVDRSAGLIEASMKMSFRSNGEKLTIKIRPSYFLDGVHTFIDSTSSWIMTTNDWGKNRENVINFANTILSLPILENNSTIKKNVICSFCGASYFTSVVTCKNCGHLLVPSGVTFQDYYKKDIHLHGSTRRLTSLLFDLVSSTYNVKFNDLYPFVVNETNNAYDEVIKYSSNFSLRKLDYGLLDFRGDYCYIFAAKMCIVSLITGYELRSGRISNEVAEKIVSILKYFFSLFSFYWMDICVSDHIFSQAEGQSLYKKTDEVISQSTFTCFNRGSSPSLRLPLHDSFKDNTPFSLTLPLFLVG